MRSRTTIEDLLKASHGGWVRVQQVAWNRSSVELIFAIDDHRNGKTRETWSVCCKNICEYAIKDANGGGLAVYDRDHPVVRQFLDETVKLRFVGKTKHAERILGALMRVHWDEVDDWVGFDAYLENPVSVIEQQLSSGRGTLATGPRFLLKRYAAVLREEDMKPRLLTTTKKPRARAIALHFGSSYIVAGSLLVASVHPRRNS